MTTTSPADFRLRAPAQDFAVFSEKNALAPGDVSGDGIGDLLVGDMLANDGSTQETGAIFAVFGSRTLNGMWDLKTTPASFSLYEPAANSHLWRVAVGRLNEDSPFDRVARTNPDACVILGPIPAGAPHLANTPANIRLTGLDTGHVIVGDVTGDGQDDLVLGSGTTIYVVPGPLANGQTYDAPSAAVMTLTNVTPNSLTLGNITGDATLDLIFGLAETKQVLVIPGGANATGSHNAADVAQIWVTTSNVKNVGFDVAAGDLDNDRRPDLIVTTWAQDVAAHLAGFQHAGVVYVVYGTGASAQGRTCLPFVAR